MIPPEAVRLPTVSKPIEAIIGFGEKWQTFELNGRNFYSKSFSGATLVCFFLGSTFPFYDDKLDRFERLGELLISLSLS